LTLNYYLYLKIRSKGSFTPHDNVQDRWESVSKSRHRWHLPFNVINTWWEDSVRGYMESTLHG